MYASRKSLFVIANLRLSACEYFVLHGIKKFCHSSNKFYILTFLKNFKIVKFKEDKIVKLLVYYISLTKERL